MQHTIQQELKSVLAFLGVIWSVFVADLLLPIDLAQFGVIPRTVRGLAGIPAMCFLHAGLYHLVSNTFPLFFLLILLAGSKARSWAIVVAIALVGGSLLWLCGRPGPHVGASLLIFGLIVFLICSGLLEKRPLPLLVSLIVGFLYGGTLLWGILPRIGSRESWDGHLCGAIAGGVIAYVLTREIRAVPKGRSARQG